MKNKPKGDLLVECQKHLGGDGGEVGACLAAHTHDVLQAVKIGTAGVVGGFAIVCG